MADNDIRVILLKNSDTTGKKQNIIADKTWSKAQIISNFSESLGFSVAKVFNSRGNEVTTSLASVVEGDSLYCAAAGETFAANQTASKKFTIAILGVAAVGKSAITFRFIQRKFVAEYEPTIEDYYVKNTNIDGPTTVSILDTAGMEDYSLLIDQWIVEKDGLILVYGVDIPDSLQKLGTFHRKIVSKYDMNDEKNAPVVVLAGNKIDKERLVTTEEGQQFADEIGVKYFETSAATDVNIDEMFTYIIKELKRRRVTNVPQQKKKKKWRCTLL